MSHTVVGRFAIPSLVALALSLAACGKKGPLYLPDAGGVPAAVAPALVMPSAPVSR